MMLICIYQDVFEKTSYDKIEDAIIINNGKLSRKKENRIQLVLSLQK